MELAQIYHERVLSAAASDTITWTCSTGPSFNQDHMKNSPRADAEHQPDVRVVNPRCHRGNKTNPRFGAFCLLMRPSHSDVKTKPWARPQERIMASNSRGRLCRMILQLHRLSPGPAPSSTQGQPIHK